MSTAVDAPQQFKQPSRKGKKAWRKNVDVTEVQEGLRMLKDEEIKGYVDLFPIFYNFFYYFGSLGLLLISEQWTYIREAIR